MDEAIDTDQLMAIIGSKCLLPPTNSVTQVYCHQLPDVHNSLLTVVLSIDQDFFLHFGKNQYENVCHWSDGA